MDALEFYTEFGRAECERVARAAGTRIGYFLQIAYGHRRPSPDLAEQLVDKSGGRMDFVALLKTKKAA